MTDQLARLRKADRVCPTCGTPVVKCSECGKEVPNLNGEAITCSNRCRQRRFRRLQHQKAREAK